MLQTFRDSSPRLGDQFYRSSRNHPFTDRNHSLKPSQNLIYGVKQTSQNSSTVTSDKRYYIKSIQSIPWISDKSVDQRKQTKRKSVILAKWQQKQSPHSPSTPARTTVSDKAPGSKDGLFQNTWRNIRIDSHHLRDNQRPFSKDTPSPTTFHILAPSILKMPCVLWAHILR